MNDSPYERAKRALDVAFASAGLLVLSPALALTAIAIRLDSPGPILFGHERVGLGGRRFRVWKFRTMVHGHRGGPSITAKGDPRVTRMGRLLRRTKLDELPQLWNVISGEMSLVGPRPEAPRYVERFKCDYEVILSIRPGVTDEASIVYRNEEELLGAADDPERMYVDEILPKKIAMAKDYVSRRDLRRDARILATTVVEVITK